MICDPLGSNNSSSVFSTIRFGKLLKERGHHVIFITAKTKGNPDESHSHGVKTYRYRCIPLPKGGGWKLALPTVGELKKVFREENILDFKNSFKILTEAEPERSEGEVVIAQKSEF